MWFHPVAAYKFDMCPIFLSMPRFVCACGLNEHMGILKTCFRQSPGVATYLVSSCSLSGTVHLILQEVAESEKPPAEQYAAGQLLRRARKIISSGKPGIVRSGLRPTGRGSRPYIWNDRLSRRIANQLTNSSLAVGHA